MVVHQSCFGEQIGVDQILGIYLFLYLENALVQFQRLVVLTLDKLDVGLAG